MTDDDDHRRSSLAGNARSALSNAGQEGRLKQAAAVTKDVALAEQASKAVTRKVTQEDAWDELRGDTELLTEIARAHYGTRLVLSRIRAGRDEADAFRRLGQDLRTLRAHAEGELSDLRAGRSR